MSDKIKDGGPAFPQPNHVVETDRGREQARRWMDDSGMSLRDWFAGMAMQGLLAHHGRYWQGNSGENLSGLIPDETAKASLEYADAMLVEREKGNQ